MPNLSPKATALINKYTPGEIAEQVVTLQRQVEHLQRQVDRLRKVLSATVGVWTGGEDEADNT